MPSLAKYGNSARRWLIGLVASQIATAAWLLARDGFGRTEQAALLVHILAGPLVLAALLPYLAMHVPRTRASARRGARVFGFAAAFTAALTLASGAGLALPALAGSWAPQTLADLHRQLGLLGGALLWVHLMLASFKPAGRAAVREALPVLLMTAGLAALVAIPLAGVQAEPGWDPAGAALSDSGARWERPPPSSRSCGTAGCHEEIHREWLESPHGKADADPYYLALETQAGSRAGYCFECHDPGALASGRASHSGEAVSCYACHAMRRVHGKKDRGNFTMAPPPGGLDEETALGRFLIRSYVKRHRQLYGQALYERSRLCAGCHLPTVSEEIPGFGLLRIENPYGRWELSRVKPLCQDCHMPEAPLPAGGTYRTHRFPGATTGDSPEQREVVARQLSGRAPIPDVNGKGTMGPLFSIELASVTTGPVITLRIADRSRIGHQFPAGAQDLVMIWLEAELRDAGGRVLARWGEAAEGGPMLPGTPVYRRGGVKRGAGPIEHAWALRGEGFGQLRPGETREVTLRTSVTTVTQGLTLQARLLYRKIHAEALKALSGRGKTLPLPPEAELAKMTAPLF